MDQKQRILVSGDVKGNFRTLFNRVDTINKKSGPFELLLCAGQFFGDNNEELHAYRNGMKHIPIPTYILGPTTDEHAKYFKDAEDSDLCTNLTYLGKRGVYTTASGIKVAYLSGVQNAGDESCRFSVDDCRAVKNSCLMSRSANGDYRGVDILVTIQGPHGVFNSKTEVHSPLISWLASEVKPRYHFFSQSTLFSERPPYRNPPCQTTPLALATRLIALADVGNSQKQKWIYALNVLPVEKSRLTDLLQKTTDETPSPYANMEFDGRLAEQQHNQNESKQYFYDMSTRGGDGQHRGKRRMQGGHDNQKRERRAFDPEKCWFCLLSPNVEKHLIISVGKSFYLAFAKGPLTNDHVLILPIEHIQKSALLDETNDWKELDQFKHALRQYFQSKDQAVSFFERNYKSSHMQINVIAVDKSIAWQLKPTFQDKAECYNIEFELQPELKGPHQLPANEPYFVVELPDQQTLITKQMRQFPLQFGREVFCAEELLNTENKVEWKECLLSLEEETAVVNKFRENFKHFDFTIDE